MSASNKDLYSAHVKNLQSVTVAFDRLKSELNASLARNDVKTADALLKVSMLLLGAWAENRLRKVMYEPGGFTDMERLKVTNERKQIERWKKAVELGFRSRHNTPNADLSTTLDATPRAHFECLIQVIDNELESVIEVRNKLAHGQWSRPLNNSNDDFSSKTNYLINSENAHSLKCKRRILEYLAQIIHDLAAGNDAFSRDFDEHYRNLENAKKDILSRSYDDWLAKMREKLERGKSRRESCVNLKQH